MAGVMGLRFYGRNFIFKFHAALEPGATGYQSPANINLSGYKQAIFNARKTNRLSVILLACINHFTTSLFFALQLKNVKFYNLHHEKS
jgi:hypothetical protein